MSESAGFMQEGPSFDAAMTLAANVEAQKALLVRVAAAYREGGSGSPLDTRLGDLRSSLLALSSEIATLARALPHIDPVAVMARANAFDAVRFLFGQSRGVA